MIQRFKAAVLGLAGLLGGCGVQTQELTTVAQDDLQKYLGKWYEVARYPNSFQTGCTASTAEYALREDGKITVLNRCRDGSVDGPVREITGTARVADPQTNARLKASFFWPFEGNYYIIDLDPDYTWAVVGEPSRKTLWILSRTPSLDEATYQSILGRLPEKGYDPARLERQVHPAEG